MVYAFLKALSDRKSYPIAIDSLKNQVGHVYVAVDKEVDYEDPKVTFFIVGNENADLDKFLILSNVKLKHNDHIFICDDDLIYPDDYVEYTIKQAKKHGAQFVAYGGNWFREFPIASYYLERQSIPIWNKHANVQSQIPSTGAFYFQYTKPLEPFIEALTDKGDMHLPFAGDITVALLLGALKLKCLCLSPKENGWFKHIEIDMSCTIYESFKDKDFEQTVKVNKYSHLLPDFSQEIKYPKISVVFVVSRIKTERNFVVEALNSLKNQIYPNYEIVWIENYNKMKTIGKCFNEGVQEATGDWVLFFADDDVLSMDYLANIASGIMSAPEDVVCISTNITMFGIDAEQRMEKAPTGCWKKSFLIENPFVEWANRYVDTEMFERMNRKEKKILILKHNYGYYYRSHQGQASGQKFVGNNDSPEHYDNITKIMEETFGEIK